MNNKQRRDLKLIGTICGVHVVALIVLWFALDVDEVIDLNFEKVISVNITNTPLTTLPPINQAERDKIAEEKRQAEEAEQKKLQEIERKKRAAEQKKKDDAKKKAALDKKKKDDANKKELAKLEKEKQDKAKKKAAEDALKKKKEYEKKKKAEELAKKKKAEALAKAKAEAKAKALAKAKAEAAARAAKIAYQKRQGVLGKHALSQLATRLKTEWRKLSFSSIQFTDPDDLVEITFHVRKNGSVISATITRRAKSQSLNSQAQKLINIVKKSSYRFPPFPSGYNKTDVKISRKFGTE